ncbi:helix-hairpin-helix domain-containing protein [Actinomadura flavalba]|uniref:helix-hairpin-helix domain-containing protein n=1 Tax=Actinomadura flavalba TaxID=1120938 RepID=UPI0003A4CF1D|nr:helix-hairpin-helix domain-containing protein [Actinomadura flavalba]
MFDKQPRRPGSMARPPATGAFPPPPPAPPVPPPVTGPPDARSRPTPGADPHGGTVPPREAPVPPPPPPVTINVHHAPPGSADAGIHVMHGVLSVVTCGLWIPVWIVHAIVMASRDPVPPPIPPVLPVPPPVPPPTAEQRNHAAVQHVAARAHRRREARALAHTNPLMARELLIGRTDVPPYRRPYDDGGLIDVNLVPAGELTRFGLEAGAAEAVVALREQIGPFSSAEELATVADLAPSLLPELLEYGLYLR